MTSTNGHYLTEENVKRVIRSGLDRLIVSVDHFEQDSYQHYRIGGRIDTVIEGIKTLVRVRSESRSTRPFIILQFLISGDNEFRLAEFRKRGYRLGADRVEFKTMQILDFEKGSPFIPESTKNSRYRKSETNGFRVKYRYFNHCWKMWHSCVVTWDGSVVPCCFDKNAEYPLGSFENENSFSSIWFGDPYKNFRSRLLHRRKEINICSNCTEGTNPWI
jgi:radical SAM protein with 4Fe4S-binding SPASM domain